MVATSGPTLHLPPVVPVVIVVCGAAVNDLHTVSPDVKLASTGPRASVYSQWGFQLRSGSTTSLR